MCLGAPWLIGLTALLCGDTDELFALVEDGDEADAAMHLINHRKRCDCQPRFLSATDPQFLASAGS